MRAHTWVRPYENKMAEQIEHPEEGLFFLPGGYVDPDGECHREAKLRPLTGREEESIADPSRDWTEASLVTALLQRTAERIGPHRPTPEIIRSLPAGDRDYLMLKLRRITFGKRVEVTLLCPRPECAKKMDIDFDLDQIPVVRKAARPSYRLTLSEEGMLAEDQGAPQREIFFRIPQGGDQEAAREWSRLNEEEMLRRLLGRCLLKIGGAEPTADRISRLSARAVDEIAGAMEQCSPRIEAEMEARCPECGHPFIHDFEIVPFFLREILRGQSRLEREVHLLGFYYHWPLREILGMTRRKRQRYLQLLTEELDRSRHSGVEAV